MNRNTTLFSTAVVLVAAACSNYQTGNEQLPVTPTPTTVASFSKLPTIRENRDLSVGTCNILSKLAFQLGPIGSEVVVLPGKDGNETAPVGTTIADESKISTLSDALTTSLAHADGSITFSDPNMFAIAAAETANVAEESLSEYFLQEGRTMDTVIADGAGRALLVSVADQARREVANAQNVGCPLSETAKPR